VRGRLLPPLYTAYRRNGKTANVRQNYTKGEKGRRELRMESHRFDIRDRNTGNLEKRRQKELWVKGKELEIKSVNAKN